MRWTAATPLAGGTHVNCHDFVLKVKRDGIFVLKVLFFVKDHILPDTVQQGNVLINTNVALLFEQLGALRHTSTI